MKPKSDVLKCFLTSIFQNNRHITKCVFSYEYFLIDFILRRSSLIACENMVPLSPLSKQCPRCGVIVRLLRSPHFLITISLKCHDFTNICLQHFPNTSPLRNKTKNTHWLSAHTEISLFSTKPVSFFFFFVDN